MVPKFEMSTYFYSNVIWLQSGPRMSTLPQIAISGRLSKHDLVPLIDKIDSINFHFEYSLNNQISTLY
jgi:hypothetical protein